MTEREKKNPFELYTEVAESWFDLFGSWAKMSAELPTPPKTSDVTEWTKPFNSYFGDWSRIYSNFLETMNKFPYDPMKDLNEAIIKGANSYVEIYNTWIKNMDKVMRKGYEVTQGLAKEEEVDVGEFYDTLRKSNEEIVNSMLESLKDTPFEEVEYVKDAQEKFLDSFSEEREQTREFFRKFFNTNVKLANSWNSMLKKVNEKFTPMLRAVSYP